MNKLTAFQAKFCLEYVKTIPRNGTAAARKAGGKGKKASLAASASRLLKYVNVRREIKRLENTINKKAEAKAVDAAIDVIEELTAASQVSVFDLLDYDEKEKNYKLKAPDKLTRPQQLAISEIIPKLHDGKVISHSYKLHDRIDILKLLGSGKGLWRTKHQIEGAFTFAEFAAGVARGEK